MNISKLLVLLTFFCMSSVCAAASQAEQEAEKLLDSMGMAQVLEQSIAQMLDVELQQNAALAPYKGVMLQFFSKHMSYESLKPSMLKLYSETFTAAELRALNQFYATDVGKKTIEKMPMLMAEGAKIGAARVQDNIGELQAMIQAEAKRIQTLQSQSN
jgi:hypothetical protein